MVDELQNLEIERKLLMEIYRKEIIINLLEESFIFNEDALRKKLNSISNENYLRKLFRLSGRVESIESFLNRI